ncbi:preprotein translocase subunit YajC [Pseudonocardia hierapolitana]|uniref:Preprotein translocase subunit YajC n=1 Tax=Pseudonocardia hierapolitana TaxID=1128676 RepID=A0A561T1E1_9PSEU|nr:preprotein translocase subunit YajC [Pseudonocardia hierapolitana]TWF80929.1 preprotein translocase subunit YajC [Pseudonocardia hierapolitana]
MDISLLFPLLILLLFIPIFLQGRRARRQQQEMQQLQAALEPGDVVMTTSGLRGTVVDASYEDTIDIEIADGVVTTWVRGAVREKVNPAADEDASAEETPAATAATEDESVAPSLEKSPLEKPAAEKDESTNGTARS